jgi:hypothetical protein
MKIFDFQAKAAWIAVSPEPVATADWMEARA